MRGSNCIANPIVSVLPILNDSMSINRQYHSCVDRLFSVSGAVVARTLLLSVVLVLSRHLLDGVALVGAVVGRLVEDALLPSNRCGHR